MNVLVPVDAKGIPEQVLPKLYELIERVASHVTLLLVDDRTPGNAAYDLIVTGADAGISQRSASGASVGSQAAPVVSQVANAGSAGALVVDEREAVAA